MTTKSIIEYQPQPAGAVPEVNVVATLMRIDKAITWCVNHIQSIEKSVLDAPQGKPVTTQAVLDMSQQYNRSFIYKLNGVITDCVINMKTPTCPICRKALPAFGMSKANPEKGFASTPTFHCSEDRMYFNWSRNNKEGWQ